MSTNAAIEGGRAICKPPGKVVAAGAGLLSDSGSQRDLQTPHDARQAEHCWMLT